LTTAIVDGADLILAESGWQNTAPPRILRITPDFQVNELASEGLQAPVTGLAFVDGKLFISHREKVSVLGGTLRDIVTGLISTGDHQNNNLLLGPDGKLYQSQGTVTNSAVVGVDSYIFGWQPLRPNGPLFVPASTTIPESERGAKVRNVPELYEMVAPQIFLIVGVVVLVGILAAAVVRAITRGRSA
jgi:hypothetical protein